MKILAIASIVLPILNAMFFFIAAGASKSYDFQSHTLPVINIIIGGTGLFLGVAAALINKGSMRIISVVGAALSVIIALSLVMLVVMIFSSPR